MQQAVPVGEGTMAAILGLEDQAVESLCTEATFLAAEKRKKGESTPLSIPAIVQTANFNAPGQVVIAGSIDAVQEAILLVKSSESFRGGKAIPLSVSAPFHCQLMAPARNQMAALFLETPETKKPKRGFCPIVPNRTARITNEPGIILELLMEQIDHPVLWKQSMLAILEAHFNTSIEFGPGKVLSGLLKRIVTPTSKSLTTHAISDTASLKALELVLKSP